MKNKSGILTLFLMTFFLFGISRQSAATDVNQGQFRGEFQFAKSPNLDQENVLIFRISPKRVLQNISVTFSLPQNILLTRGETSFTTVLAPGKGIEKELAVIFPEQDIYAFTADILATDLSGHSFRERAYTFVEFKNNQSRIYGFESKFDQISFENHLDATELLRLVMNSRNDFHMEYAVTIYHGTNKQQQIRSQSLDNPKPFVDKNFKNHPKEKNTEHKSTVDYSYQNSNKSASYKFDGHLSTITPKLGEIKNRTKNSQDVNKPGIIEQKVLTINENDGPGEQKNINSINALPDLAITVPSGWSDALVVSHNSDDFITASAFEKNESVYLHGAFACFYESIPSGVEIWGDFFRMNESDYGTLEYVNGAYTTDGMAPDTYLTFTNWPSTTMSGDYTTFIFTADIDGYVEETDEENNIAFKEVDTGSATSKPNLTFNTPTGWDGPIVVSTVPGTNTNGSSFDNDQTVYVDFSFRCDDESIAETFTSVLKKDGATIKTVTKTGMTLGTAHYETDVVTTLPSEPASSCTFTVVVDDGNNVDESNEGDNQATANVSGLSTGGGGDTLPNIFPYTPDGWSGPIVVSDQVGTNTTPDPTSFSAGETVYIDWATTLDDAAVESGTRVDFMLYRNNVDLQGWYIDTGMDPAYYYGLEDFETQLSAENTTTFKMVHDSENAVEESNEGDNEASITVGGEVNGTPNLAFYTPTGWDGPIVVSSTAGNHTHELNFAPNQAVFVDYAFQNNGSADINPNQEFKCRLYKNGTQIDEKMKYGLAVGNSASFEDIQTTVGSSGSTTFQVFLDATDRVGESDESDNDNKDDVTVQIEENESLLVSIPQDLKCGANANNSFTASVNIEDTSGLDIFSFSFDVNFDASSLIVTDVTPGTLTSDWGTPTFNIQDGSVRTSGAGSSALSGAGSLVVIHFETKKAHDVAITFTLDLNNTVLNEGDPAAQEQDGLVTIERTDVNVMGSVAYYGSEQNPLSGVTVELLGSTTQTAVTDKSGNFNIVFPTGENCTLSANKAAESGVVAAISPFDASLVLRNYVGSYEFNNAEKIAGDVSGNGSLSPFDASIILRYYVGQNVSDTNIATWQFCVDPINDWTNPQTTYQYSPLTSDKSGQDFTGILLGDCSGNFASALAKSNPAELVVNEIHHIDANILEMPINIRGRSFYYSAGFTIEYDASVLDVQSVVPGDNKEGALLITNSKNGKLDAAIASGVKLTSENLATVRFVIKDMENLNKAHLAMPSFEVDGYKVNLQNASLKVEIALLPTEFVLNQNFPNPFNPSTQISYSVPKTGHVDVLIYNTLGQKIRVLENAIKEPGNYKVTWDGRDEYGVDVTSGIYLVQMNSNSFKQTIKMIKTK